MPQGYPSTLPMRPAGGWEEPGRGKGKGPGQARAKEPVRVSWLSIPGRNEKI